jgi:methyl-accepting chemotaxis protein
MKITKRQLKIIIKEEKTKLLVEEYHEMYESDQELQELGEAIESLVHWTMETNILMDRMAERYGELAANTTRAQGVANAVEELANRFDQALDDMIRLR